MPISEAKMLERRHAMLESARGLLARVGYRRCTFKALAEAADVTAPTLYSAFGNREALLLEAIADDVNQVIREGAASERTGLDRIIHFLGIASDMLTTKTGYPETLRHAATPDLPPAGAAIGREMHAGILRVFSKGIEEMRAAGEIEEWADTPALAMRLGTMQRGMRDDWLAGLSPSGQLAEATVFGIALLLAGATRGGARERCQAIIRERQGSLGAPLPE